jgi:hypothetical protein
MPTPINHKVARVTRDSYRVLYASANKARPIVVTILPGDVLEFREHGCKTKFMLAIDTAFKYAVRLDALAKAAEKHKAKCGRKGIAHNAPRKVKRGKL